MSSMRQIFQTLSQHKKDFNLRDTQVDMAENISSFIREGLPGSLIAEAGTGTGKSLAYLIPLLKSGQKAIISTNTKALQKQIAEEITKLHGIFPDAKCAVLEGAANYACMLNAEDLDYMFLKMWIDDQADRGGKGMISDFRKEGQKNLNTKLWNLIQADSKLCHFKCRYFDNCFFQKAKREAESAHILILNHDLLLLNYRVQSDIFKDFPVIVIDEAHHFPQTARKTLRDSLANTTVSSHFKSLNVKLKLTYKVEWSLDLDLVKNIEEQIFNSMPTSDEGTIRIWNWPAEVMEGGRLLEEAIRLGIETLETYGGEEQGIDLEISRLEELSRALNSILKAENRNWIKTYTVSRDGDKINQRFECTPLDVDSLLEDFFATKSVIMTSATLRSGKTFDYYKNLIGQPDAKTLHYPSPFEKKNTPLFIPKTEIDPKAENYNEIIASYIADIHKKMNGRSLFLFTSREDMEATEKSLPAAIRKQFYVQKNTADVPNMVKALKTEKNISLMGLSTLWEGIDVVGEALSCVCITRMPFYNRGDILVRAMEDKWLDDKKNFKIGSFFMSCDLPQMLIKLKQGFGRLVRHENDVGLLALLDNRFLSKQYTLQIIELLEDYSAYSDLDEAIKNIPKLK